MYSVQKLAQLLDVRVDPSLSLDITGVATMEEAQAGDLTFLANPKYVQKVEGCKAGAILISPKFEGKLPIPALYTNNPYLAFARAIELFHSKPLPPRGIHPTAVIGQGCTLGEDISIGAYVVIGNHVTLGDHVTIHPHCVIYDGAVLGAGCLLHSHVVIRENVQLGQRVIVQNTAVIGADGFGFAPVGDGTYHKIPQVGTVILGDDVEVQSLSSVDRGTLEATTVGEGTKIDNLVQIGHGSKVGKNTVICGQVALAGSTIVGDRVVLAGQSGVSGHLTIGDDVIAASGTGITQSIPKGKVIAGFPAVEVNVWKRYVTQLKNLPELSKRVRRLERALEIKNQESQNSDDG
ncbi:MAG: UDP-3-O-(3-hydroxymyristoyl)glucosamine N-acyltransferase [Gloeobacterales cyanobacterium]